jgi:methionyl-tRNA formyltransferase
VKEAATSLGLAVFQPEHLRSPERLTELAALRAEAMVVAAYGLILPQAVLDLFPWGCWNIHASLLPRWRGAAPIARAIEAGDPHTGVCIMRMEAGLDSGPVLARSAIPIADDATAGTLQDRLAALGAEQMVDAVARLDALRSNCGRGDRFAELEPQASEGVTYAHKLRKEEARLDFALDASLLARRIRAFDPHPGCYTVASVRTAGLAGQSRRAAELSREPSAAPLELIKCWSARALPIDAAAPPGTITMLGKDGPVIACGRQSLELLQLQAAGGRRLAAAVLVRQLGLRPGMRLG